MRVREFSSVTSAVSTNEHLGERRLFWKSSVGIVLARETSTLIEGRGHRFGCKNGAHLLEASAPMKNDSVVQTASSSCGMPILQTSHSSILFEIKTCSPHGPRVLARRDWIFSISSAKQPETRTRRIEKACDMLASGKRRLCCFPGIK